MPIAGPAGVPLDIDQRPAAGLHGRSIEMDLEKLAGIQQRTSARIVTGLDCNGLAPGHGDGPDCQRGILLLGHPRFAATEYGYQARPFKRQAGHTTTSFTMPDTTLDFNSRHSDSPQEQRRYLWSQASNLPNDRPRDAEDEKMREFLRRWAGVKLEGDK